MAASKPTCLALSSTLSDSQLTAVQAAVDDLSRAGERVVDSLQTSGINIDLDWSDVRQPGSQLGPGCAPDVCTLAAEHARVQSLPSCLHLTRRRAAVQKSCCLWRRRCLPAMPCSAADRHREPHHALQRAQHLVTQIPPAQVCAGCHRRRRLAEPRGGARRGRERGPAGRRRLPVARRCEPRRGLRGRRVRAARARGGRRSGRVAAHRGRVRLAAVRPSREWRSHRNESMLPVTTLHHTATPPSAAAAPCGLSVHTKNTPLCRRRI
jgi:hypothetical protein